MCLGPEASKGVFMLVVQFPWSKPTKENNTFLLFTSGSLSVHTNLFNIEQQDVNKSNMNKRSQLMGP